MVVFCEQLQMELFFIVALLLVNYEVTVKVFRTGRQPEIQMVGYRKIFRSVELQDIGDNYLFAQAPEQFGQRKAFKIYRRKIVLQHNIGSSD